MKRLSAWSLLALAGLFGSFLWAQDSKGISWKHGLSFQVRKAGQNAFTDDTPKFGAEVFLDKDISQAVYITEEASVGLGTSGKFGDAAEVKAPVLFHALEVRVRKAGQTSFENATKISSEVFKDTNAENLVYISEKGSIAVMPSGDIKAPDKIKDPVWFHALELKVRAAAEKEFDDKTKKVGLEVYKDENTNQLFYVTEEGHIAITPAGSTAKPAKVENPVWFHAFTLKARKADEKVFSKDTVTYGVEVYKDENTNSLIYISEKGSIAVVPAAGASKPTSSKEPKWLYGRSFRVRTAKEKDFNDKTQAFGGEVYKDEITGNLVYITEKGSLAVSRGN